MKIIKFLVLDIFLLVVLTIILSIFIINKSKNQTTNTVDANSNILGNFIINHNNANEETTNVELNQSPENVIMTIKEGTLTKTGATVIIKDNNITPYSYNYWFKIQKKEDGKWVDLEIRDKNYSFPAVAFNLGKDKTFEQKIDWQRIYGRLRKGEYRLIKNLNEINNLYVSVKFSIS